jgi:hypothetical protein
MKRISAEAYQALREALPAIFWNKNPYKSYLRAALRDSPGLLAGLPFDDTKRVVADALVDRLIEKERDYQAVTLGLMLEVASMRQFPNIEHIKDPEDRALRLGIAKSAVEHLRTLTAQYAELVSDQEKLAAARDAERAQAAAQRKFADEVEGLRQRWLVLQAETNHQKRGKAFEPLLSDLFVLFDMEPRLAYDLEREQIDGSLSFDTDDYVVEARWREKPTDRGDADIFAAKVRRKGKNALGLFVSVSGFTKDAREEYGHSTPFMTMDGSDVYLVLEQRLRLDELLKIKKRHANETGSCYMPASEIL